MVIWMDYLVTDIKDITSKRRLVYINYEPAFGLYAGELIAYDISIDKVIPQNEYDEIIKVLTKRATLRGVKLIKDNDYTLIDDFNNSYFVNMKFYIEYKLEIGDIIYLPKSILIETNSYAFGKIEPENKNAEDIIKVVTNKKEIYLQR